MKLRKSFTRFSFGKKSNKVKRESLINIDDICLFVMVVLLNSHIHNIGNYMGKISTFQKNFRQASMSYIFINHSKM